MKVEHITLGGNSVIRDTSVILMETINLLEAFRIREGRVKLPFPHTSFDIQVTATMEGAIFDVTKGDNIAVMNVCCFADEQRDGLMIHVSETARKFGVDIVIEPKLDKFIYSILVNPFSLTPDEMQTAGEIELYIYYMLYLANQK